MKRREREDSRPADGDTQRTLIILGTESERVKIKLFQKVDKCYMICQRQIIALTIF